MSITARRTLLFLLALSLSNGLAPISAPAKEVRFPEKGAPAYVFVLPDDWSTQADDSGNLIMASANRTTVLVILVGEYTGLLDDVAKVALETAKATPYQRKIPAEISGGKGHTYFSTIKNAQGVSLSLELTIVRVTPTHIASATLILADGLAKADETAARIVRNGLKLVTE